MSLLFESITIEGPGGFQINGPIVLVIPAFLAIICGFIASLVWLKRDAQRRQKNGLIAIVFVIFAGWPLSLLWWLWLRPAGTANEKNKAC